jgi:1,4-alpha-glucan branching enzyme
MTLKVADLHHFRSANSAGSDLSLGLQKDQDSSFLVITTFQAGAISVDVLDKKSLKVIAKLIRLDASGLFSKKLRRKKHFEYQLKITNLNDTKIIDDPFAFSPTLGELDLHLLAEGNHQNPYKKLGAHLIAHQGVEGVSFALWAPNASYVAVVGDFNHWNGRLNPMINLNFHGKKSGYWQIFIPGIVNGSLYKFELKDTNGHLLPIKADPYGIQAQYRPDTASIINAETSYFWQDNAWLKQREQRNSRHAPMSIYEVHLGSWRRTEHNEYLNYRDIAAELIPYVLDMGFTHLQLMPVSEFPFDGSWGYQPVGLFAPSARFGNRSDFQFFVDACHQANIGLLIDWVPGHFPNDEHGLANFDGTHLFEHADPRQGFHPDWNTLIYNYGRVEVANFLRASALHWLDTYHVDGIRVDAVASMLYLDYSRKEGEWLPNKDGGRENLEAVAFLQRFNEELYSQYPGTFSIAEESTSWPGISRPTRDGGLGFGYKWNMGWMNDSLRYMQEDPINRCHHHDLLSFSLVYAFDENFILPLSHDEVVHGKGSILARMPGDTWQKFANLRAYYGFMWAHPGKKLLFMGCEFAQGREWDHDKALDWQQLDIDAHSGVQHLVKDLNKIYCEIPALHQLDCQVQGFSWLEHNNARHSIYSFIRYGENNVAPVIVVCNFTPQTHQDFSVGVPTAGRYQEILNTDAAIYGGSNQGNLGATNSINQPCNDQIQSIKITVPPLSTVIFSLASVGD